MNSFKKNLVLIYTTKFFGILSGFLSLLLVVPKLTSNPAIYGVYTICVSLGIFFSYADLGFLSACQKYAAEYYVQKNLQGEMRVVAFVLFILAVFIGVITLLLFVIANSPELIIKAATKNDLLISSKLIFILAIFSPSIIIQKLNVLVYSIRIEDYIYQSIEIIFNLFKILSIGFFVSKTSYDIVGYFLTTQILSLCSGLICVYIIVKKYDYQIIPLLKYFRFSKEMYNKTKSLAFSSLLMTIAWILYFEFDTIILSKFYGIKVVATYAVAVVFLNFSRTLYNVIFGPYLAYFYRFTGVNDKEGLYVAFTNLLKWTFPLMVIPPLVLITYMDSIIRVWVGNAFSDSILISRFFVFIIAMTSFCIPISYFMIVNSFNRIMRIMALILPVLFYSCLLLYDYYGLGEKSLALATMTTIFCNLIGYVYFLGTLLGTKIIDFYVSLLKKIILPLISLYVIYWLLPPLFINIKGDLISYLKLGTYVVFTMIIPLFVYYVREKSIRTIFLKVLNFRKTN